MCVYVCGIHWCFFTLSGVFLPVKQRLSLGERDATLTALKLSDITMTLRLLATTRCLALFYCVCFLFVFVCEDLNAQNNHIVDRLH